MEERYEEITPKKAKAMLGRGGECAWKGCQRAYKGRELPGDWRFLLVSPVMLMEPEALQRLNVDGVLCPVHVRELWATLKIGELGKPPV